MAASVIAASVAAAGQRASRHQPRADGRGLGGAAVDRQIVDEAPTIGLLVPQGVDLVSKRVGNHQRNPVWGVMLSQLWVV
jgi:hypothetical protein